MEEAVKTIRGAVTDTTRFSGVVSNSRLDYFHHNDEFRADE